MLKLYLNDVPHQNFNDFIFNDNIRKINFNDKNIQNIIKTIDKVEYAGDLMVYSKFQNNVLVHAEDLSTGCKTAINIYTFPNEIFTLAECGENALQVIFNFKHGNAYMTRFVIPRRFNNSIKVYSDIGEFETHNNKQLEKILSSNYQYKYNKYN